MRENFIKSKKEFGGEREQHVENIARALKSGEFTRIAVGESIGGNAGEGRLAVNAFADIETGEIMAFGNFQNIKKDIRNNPRYAQVTFVCSLDFKFLHIISGDPLGFGRKVSEQALDNLRAAAELVNGRATIHKTE